MKSQNNIKIEITFSSCISLTGFIGVETKLHEIRIIPENSGHMVAISREHPPCFIGINYS